MVSGNEGLRSAASFQRRSSRARELAARLPEAGEVLAFYAEVAALQADAVGGGWNLLPRLVALVRARGPEPLARAAEALDADAAVARYRSGDDRISPASFFARALLQLEGPCSGEHVSQLAVLRPEGDGTALALACGTCFEEWPWPRAKCPSCASEADGVIVRLAAAEMPQVEVRACEACRRYVGLVRLDREPSAIPEVDEIGAIALDLEARSRGYEKLQPNLLGM